MTGLFDGAVDVLAHVIVLGSIFGAMYVLDRLAARRRHAREWPGVHELDNARRVTSPRSIP